jgi:hypothetical protein
MKKTTTPKKTTAPSSVSKSEIKKESAIQPIKEEKVSKPKAPKKETVKPIAIDKACKTALAKLKELNIDDHLQAEIEWCLGSYESDKNPSGLYHMAKRALAIFVVELASKTKGVTAKLVSDLEKAIGEN